MTFREKIHEMRKKFHDKITDYKLVKICTMAIIFVYIPLLVIGVIIAAFFGPEGYTIWTHYISDLGSFRYTPAPYLYDLAAIIAGILTIPFTFYMEQRLAPVPKSENDLNKTSRLRLRLGSYAFLFSLIGNISYIGVGIFSEDRNYLGLHGITSVLSFVGFTFGAFFMGWLIVLYSKDIPKSIGIYGIVGPLTTIITYQLIDTFDVPLTELFEWILLFSILAWIIPLALFIFKNGKK
jgi:hypothetical membrane protein